MELTHASAEVLKSATQLARERGHTQVAPAHIGSVVFGEADGRLGCSLLRRAGADPSALSLELGKELERLPKQSPPPAQIGSSSSSITYLNSAEALRKKSGDSHVAVDHLILAALGERTLKRCLVAAGVDINELRSAIAEIRSAHSVDSRHAESKYDALSKYGIDLVAEAAAGRLDPVIGRDQEIRRLIQILARRRKNNPVLIGEPGVGKTAIVEGLAQRIYAGDVPENLQCSLYSLDMGSLVAGAKYQGEFEERVKAVLDEVKASKEGVILFIDEVHLIVGAGRSQGSMDCANLFKPLLARGQLRCIGATTLAEHRESIEKDAALERRFQNVHVSEPSVDSTISILRGLSEKYSNHHGVTISDGALVAAATLSSRYITQRFLPDKAIDLLDEACAKLRVQLDSRPEEIDVLERKKLRLQIEEAALVKEKDAASQDRLQNLRLELSTTNEKLKPLLARWSLEKSRLDEIRTLKEKLEALKLKAISAKRKGDVMTAADLEYGAIPDLSSRIKYLSSKEAESVSEDSMLSSVVVPRDVMDVVSRWTGVPVGKMSLGDRQRLLGLAERLSCRVIGQNEAVQKCSNAVVRSRAGLAKQGQPTGSFLFLGPTGVGKTELAKALAFELLDSEKSLVRIDMSEFSEAHSVSRLIGSPPGYVGHDKGGQLTEAVRRRPFSLILLDEIEKSHQNVRTVLLQLLDDGRLTDGQGRVVDFSSCVIVMTSNVGAEHILSDSSEDSSKISALARKKVEIALRRSFRPELLNRLSDVVIFNRLQASELRRICQKYVSDVAARLKNIDLSIEFSRPATDFVISESYDPRYGARPLQRYIEDNCITPLSYKLVSGKLPNGSCIKINLKSGSELDFEVQRAAKRLKVRRPEEP